MASPPTTFESVAKAKEATLKLIDVLYGNREMLIELAMQGETQQQKISKLMPEVQKLLAQPTQELGFPPGPMGLMIAFGALKKSADSEGGGVIQHALDLIQQAMMTGTVDGDALASCKESLM
eukprot:CAMPEP_0115853752 /NCGR_PEP_ID=MMETSP0287-20121206/13667_1 /TAXON_ID=412157 /ORGANISM="Chrysochromulina rotalis, Strain UIO044" /LENGTH=121 /DNA_ID=CAMNT_0003307841 /DNA_START=13 /DNA_END=378 /DNA_ORIENTATION=+